MSDSSGKTIGIMAGLAAVLGGLALAGGKKKSVAKPSGKPASAPVLKGCGPCGR